MMTTHTTESLNVMISPQILASIPRNIGTPSIAGLHHHTTSVGHDLLLFPPTTTEIILHTHQPLPQCFLHTHNMANFIGDQLTFMCFFLY
ncbi:hypothetical protein XELAEV_18033021mg [Xenopus laevis]|uniref:Uncharacterized protein n=1 Tax=Xenopus laevis TaxID=8355 RepID=A0A974HDK7_XENLA|nr:hypothetical protein XELAEV_18033021mg [Xenopus laevis]